MFIVSLYRAHTVGSCKVVVKLAISAIVLLSVLNGALLADKDQPAEAVLELGAARSWDQHFTEATTGPHIALEFTPVENKLAIEAGWTRLSGDRTRDQEVDLIFKKPWKLSPKAELMIGVGPEWIHTSEERHTANSAGVEGLIDFMWWPSKKHRFGGFIESSYDYDSGRAKGRSLGVSGGLLIAIRIGR